MTTQTHVRTVPQRRPPVPPPAPSKRPPLCLALPEPGLALEQDQEWCVLRTEGGWRQIRFHDYAAIYRVPGLYEHLFDRVLRCNSPRVIRALLRRALREADYPAGQLRVLDVGAGNGMVGEQLIRLGVAGVYGVDLLPEAAAAAERDRAGIYSDYWTGDLTQLHTADEQRLRRWNCNALTCVAALGFGDIPPAAFLSALRFVATDGWVVFNIKAEFVERPSSDFACLISKLRSSGTLEVVQSVTYRHRFATSGRPLEYVALAARLRRRPPSDGYDVEHVERPAG